MPIDREFLGRKVARYRVAQMAQPLDVFRGTGIDVERLCAIENGEVEPTGDEILILADYFHCDYRFFVSNERVAPIDQVEELYRAHPKSFDTQADRIAIHEFLYLCETEAALQAELGRVARPFGFVTVGSYFKGHGEDAATELRKHFHLDDDTVPENVYGLFRHCGVHVFRRKLRDSGISGLFVKHPVAGKCALVNFIEDIYRQRFSAAHEMGHAIFDAEANSTSVTFDRDAGGDRVELRANRFASCFLMPPARLRKLPNPASWTAQDAIRWARHFRVSCYALAVALAQAKLVDDSAFKRIKAAKIPAQAKIDPEISLDLNDSQRARKEYLLERGLSSDYVDLCFDALHGGYITVGRLAEAFLCGIHELGEIAQLYGRSLHGH